MKIAIAFSAVALIQPEWFTWIKPHIPILLGIIMLGMGVSLRFKDLAEVWTSPKQIAAGLAFQYTLMPALAFAIGTALQLSPELMVGFVIVGSCPGGTASNVIVYLARANLALSITLTLVSTFLAPIVTPLLIYAILQKSIDINVVALMKSTFWIVLFPLLDGLVIRHFFQRQLRPVLAIFPSVSIIAISVIIACVVALNQQTLLAFPVLVFLAVILHNGLGLALGYWGARMINLPIDAARTLSVETGMQNSGLGVALASSHFSPLSALPGAIFSFWHNFSGIILAKVWSRNP